MTEQELDSDEENKCSKFDELPAQQAAIDEDGLGEDPPSDVPEEVNDLDGFTLEDREEDNEDPDIIAFNNNGVGSFLFENTFPNVFHLVWSGR